MGVLGTLKLTTAKRTKTISPVAYRRDRLARRLAEQIALAKAQRDNTQYVATKMGKVLDVETGEKRTVQLNKRVKEWWFTAETGKTCVALRYGATLIELAKGKTAVELANKNELVATLEMLYKAVQDGKLDSQLEAASSTVRSGFIT